MTFNTIAPAPPTRKLPPQRRALAIALGFLGGMAGNVAIGYMGFSFYTRNTVFLPYDTTSSDLSTPTSKKYNPASNPPICIDHAARVVPLEKLKVKEGDLANEFCRGVWSGLGYAFQRRYLEKKYRAMEGRKDMLWDRDELAKAEYDVGTKITDHFEVVERTPEKIVVRCGDSPLNNSPRPSDGLFSMEVTEDKDAGTATFHLKSVFVDSTSEGKNAQPMPWFIQFLHRQYTKLLMETAVRKMMK